MMPSALASRTLLGANFLELRYGKVLFLTNFGECPKGEVRRIPLPRLSEKGSEQRYEGGFGCHEEAEMGRKEPSGRSVGLRHGHLQDFSDSLSPLDFIHSCRIAKRFG
jgi:hypothetical protein